MSPLAWAWPNFSEIGSYAVVKFVAGTNGATDPMILLFFISDLASQYSIRSNRLLGGDALWRIAASLRGPYRNTTRYGQKIRRFAQN